MKNSVPDESFSYDPVGNRLTSGPSSPLLSYSYNNNNQLNSYNGVSFGYDSNGNTTSKTDTGGTSFYNYSIDNRLLTVNTSTISASYQYDHMGRRIRKTVNGTTINYLWDKNILLADLDDSGNILKTYLHNPYNNEPISMTEDINTYWYLNDHLMTPQNMVDFSGTVVWSADYKAFGEVTIDPTSTIENNLRFPGQYLETETNLHYNYRRYYYPDIGRYFTSDIVNLTSLQITKLDLKRATSLARVVLLNASIPKDINAFFNTEFIDFQHNILLHDPIMQNAYIYSRQNSLKYTDPKGESWFGLIPVGFGLSYLALYSYCMFKCTGCKPPDCPPIKPEPVEKRQFDTLLTTCFSICAKYPIEFGIEIFTRLATLPPERYFHCEY